MLDLKLIRMWNGVNINGIDIINVISSVEMLSLMIMIWFSVLLSSMIEMLVEIWNSDRCSMCLSGSFVVVVLVKGRKWVLICI